MDAPATPPSQTKPVDTDLADQSEPGQGIPSQDPNPEAQSPLAPDDAEREAKSVLIGGGAMAGAATGAAIGAAVAGPVGVLVGASAGAVAGALGGAVGGVINTALGEAAAKTAHGADSGDSTDAVHLHIEDTGGSGRTIVLIHGWPLSGKAWAPQISVLQASGYRVVAYDRRGFGQSDKPPTGYDYDVFADDLQRVIKKCDSRDVTLVGFSMGGGEVARYVSRHGESHLHSVVFASAVPPFLLHTADNPKGPLSAEQAQIKRHALGQDRDAFFDAFIQSFFSANGVLQVSEAERTAAIALCQQSSQHAALASMDAFSNTDFRQDLERITVPTLVIHGEADAIVPIEGSGERTHRTVAHSQLVRVAGAPHGLNLSHAKQFNAALLAFLRAYS